MIGDIMNLQSIDRNGERPLGYSPSLSSAFDNNSSLSTNLDNFSSFQDVYNKALKDFQKINNDYNQDYLTSSFSNRNREVGLSVSENLPIYNWFAKGYVSREKEKQAFRAREVDNYKNYLFDLQKMATEYQLRRKVNLTKYQDEVESIKRAGFNPYIALKNLGNITPVNFSSFSKTDFNRKTLNSSKNSSTGLLGIILKLLMGAGA